MHIKWKPNNDSDKEFTLLFSSPHKRFLFDDYIPMRTAQLSDPNTLSLEVPLTATTPPGSAVTLSMSMTLRFVFAFDRDIITFNLPTNGKLKFDEFNCTGLDSEGCKYVEEDLSKTLTKALF